MPRPCPSAEELQQLILGCLPESAAGEVEAHVMECSSCQAATARIDVGDTFVDEVRAAGRAVRQLAGRVEEEDRPRVEQLIANVSGLHTLAPSDTQTSAQNTRPCISTPADEAWLDQLAASWRPPEQPDELGRLGGYRVLKLLGAGGMGAVFLAEDTQLQRRVALKVMRPQVAAVPAAAERFLREARAAAAVKHDHVVTIYQVGQDCGAPFIAQELLGGETLEDRLARDCRLSVEEAVAICQQVAAGLAAAHARGLMHRDIKPANIWLESSGQESGDGSQESGGSQKSVAPDSRLLTPERVKLLDFGLARAWAEDAHLTQSGQIVGTPAYMAPEQAAGKKIDHRADLFSLGVVLYRMLTGISPFQRENLTATLLAVSSETPPAAGALDASIPKPLSDLVARLLARQPAERPASATEVKRELAYCGARIPLPASKKTTPSGRKWTVAAMIAAVVILAGAIVIKIKRPGGEETTITAPEGTNITLRDDGAVLIEPPRPKDLGKEVKYVWPADAPAPAIAPFNAKQANGYQVAWAEHLGVPAEQSNSLGGKMILIPPGEFMMGSTDEQIAAAIELGTSLEPTLKQTLADYVAKLERPRHPVVLTRPFLMGSTEVTAGQFRAFVEATQYVTEQEERLAQGQDTSHTKTWRLPQAYSIGDELPVGCVTWNDAVAYCNWLSLQEDLSPCYRKVQRDWQPTSGSGYRLPTEAEWEFACRAGTITQYFFGDDAGKLREYASYLENSDTPSHVGARLPNAFGLHDMHGNVQEWCQDKASYYAVASALDPQGSTSGNLRMLRDGNWFGPAVRCRSAYRESALATHTLIEYGFRVVRGLTVPEPTAAPAATAPSSSPLDAFDPAQIPDQERFEWQPKELVAVLGEHAWRHWGPVTSVSINPEGTLIASTGAYDGVRLWDAATGKQIRGWPGQCADFSPDGNCLFIGGEGELVVLDTATWETRSTFKNFTQTKTLAISLDGSTLAAWTRDSIRVCDLATGAERLNVPFTSFLNTYLNTIDLSADGKTLAAAADDGLFLWSVATGERLTAPEAKSVKCVAFSPNGQLLAAQTERGPEILGREVGGRRLALTGHSNSVKSFAFSRDGELLASGGGDQSLRIWDSRTGKAEGVYLNHRGGINCLAFTRNGQTLVSVGDDATVRLWNVGTGKQINAIQGHCHQVSLLALAPDERTLALGAVGYGLGRITLWDVPTRQPLTAWEADECLYGLAIGQKGATLATCGYNGVQLWDLPSGEKQSPLENVPVRAYAVKFAPDGATLSAISPNASTSASTELRSWDLSTGKVVGSFDVGPLSAYGGWLAYSSDGAMLAVGDQQTVNLWDFATHTSRAKLENAEGGLRNPSFTPDGKRILVAAGTADPFPAFFETSTGQIVEAYRGGHKQLVTAAVLLPDGKTIVSAGNDGQIIQWTTPRERRVLCRLPGPVLNLALAADGRHLFTGNSNGTVYVLRLK